MSDNLYKEALKKFKMIYGKIARESIEEPTAMALATADAAARPSVRIVLLKEYDEKGFVFFTNMESRKGQELKQNQQAALCFYWDGQSDQIRIEGHVEMVSTEESDAYWATRPKDSQIGAWVSHQSRTVDSYEEFLKSVDEKSKEFKTGLIPRPSYWGGYRLQPSRIEFWKRKPYRLHERTLYEKLNDVWKKSTLYP